MRIRELFESDYTETIKRLLIEYLTSLMSKGTEKISTKQVIMFLKQNKQLYIDEKQIDELLQGTGFEVNGSVIQVRDDEEPDAGGIGGPPPPSTDVVGNMAKNQIAKGDEL